MSSPNKAIGGYFELELPTGKGGKYPGALRYQSARAAFFALLQQMPDTKRVWAPTYICDSMLAPIYAAGKRVEFYSINERFAIDELLTLHQDDLLLYVNYFGVCGDNVADVLLRYSSAQVIIDCSQAFFSGPYDCLATIYSPRKFFGVPDGGLLVTKQVLTLPPEQDQGSVSRMDHLVRRIAFSAEEGYASYKLAEESLNDLTPRRMSALTMCLLESIDYMEVEKKRKRNFKMLHNALGTTNLLSLTHTIDAPMCYPYLPSKLLNKACLVKHRIFIPTYWPDVGKRAHAGDFSPTAASKLLAIPCDQRYELIDLNAVVMKLNHELIS